MKIGLLIYGSLNTLSGGYLYDRKLVQHLRERSDSVEIVSLPWRSYWQHLGDNLRPQLYRRLRNLDVDLLLQDELNHPSLFLINRWLRKRVDYPIISIVHHLRISEQEHKQTLWYNLYAGVERRYLQSVDGFIFNSDTTRASVADLEIDVSTSVVAYPAADHLPEADEERDERADESGANPIRLLFVGNLIERKGLHVIIAALARLGSYPWTLDIVGDPMVDTAYAKSIRQQIADAELDQRITFRGRVGDVELAAQYARSDLLIVPSYEGFGIVYMEAMRFGLPVIASTAGAAHEIVAHGENGFLIEPDDATTLARQIRTLLDDRARLCQMSRAARRHYAQHPTWRESMSWIRAWLHTYCNFGRIF